MLLVFLIHIAFFICLPNLSDSRSITFTLSYSILWFSVDTWSVIADMLLVALVFFALVNVPVMLSTSLCSMFFDSYSHKSSSFSDVRLVTVLHGIWYTTSTFESSPILSLGCTSTFLSVVWGFTAGEILWPFKILIKGSRRPLTYSTVTLWLCYVSVDAN